MKKELFYNSRCTYISGSIKQKADVGDMIKQEASETLKTMATKNSKPSKIQHKLRVKECDEKIT